jgi:hypothetical protein
MNEKKETGLNPNRKHIQGIVTPRKCHCCGHHEIGITTKEGRYIPLKQGMQITLEGPWDEDA